MRYRSKTTQNGGGNDNKIQRKKYPADFKAKVVLEAIIDIKAFVEIAPVYVQKKAHVKAH